MDVLATYLGPSPPRLAAGASGSAVGHGGGARRPPAAGVAARRALPVQREQQRSGRAEDCRRVWEATRKNRFDRRLRARRQQQPRGVERRLDARLHGDVCRRSGAGGLPAASGSSSLRQAPPAPSGKGGRGGLLGGKVTVLPASSRRDELPLEAGGSTCGAARLHS